MTTVGTLKYFTGGPLVTKCPLNSVDGFCRDLILSQILTSSRKIHGIQIAFLNGLAEASNTSQPFVLKVNTTLSCVEGNTVQSFTAADSLLAQPGAKQIIVRSHTPTCVHALIHTHTHTHKC